MCMLLTFLLPLRLLNVTSLTAQEKNKRFVSSLKSTEKQAAVYIIFVFQHGFFSVKK